MGICGNLKTMTLPDLLQWASVNRKTGTLELERNKCFKRIAFLEGTIVACSSTDSPSQLGQFLLARGKITTQDLKAALERQKQTGNYLGATLQEMGLLTSGQVTEELSAKAEEIIYSLFDWTDATFRFRQGDALSDGAIEVDISVDGILLNGLQRLDEINMIRGVFDSSGIVLERSNQPIPRQVEKSGMARRILDSIDGERTLGEVLQRASTSEYLVLKFLYHLYRKDGLTIKTTREPDPESRTLLDEAEQLPDAALDDAAETATGAVDPAELETKQELEEELRDLVAIVDAPTAQREAEDAGEPNAEIGVAELLMARGEYVAALEVLNACRRAHPGRGELRHLIHEAEMAYLERVRSVELSSTKVPALVRPADELRQENLPPDSLCVIDLIDGEANINSIVGGAPLREVEVLRALQRLLARGLIEIPGAAADPALALPTVTEHDAG